MNSQNESANFEKNLLNDIEMTITSKTKYPSFYKNIRNYFRDFSRNTNLYGFKYVAERKRFIIERLYWMVFICLTFYLSSHVVTDIWIKWNHAPVVIFSNQSPKPVWQIPFPAITICPETKIRRTEYNFTDYYHKVLEYMSSEEGNLTSEELQLFSDASLLCDNHLYTSGNKTTDYRSIEYFKRIAPSLQDSFFACKWSSLNETCDNLFTPVLTDDGLCFTFNMLDRSELFTDNTYFQDNFFDHGKSSEGWTLENGYAKNLGKYAYPRRALSFGSKNGLFLLLRDYEQNLDYVCRGPVQGFKVLLHDPSEVPRLAGQYFRVPLNQEVVVSVKPDLTTTSQNLRNYLSNQRQCFFSGERRLKFFQRYTQENCQIECLANFTLANCGCVAYHMPRDRATNICGSGSNFCMFEAEQELLLSEMEFETSSDLSFDGSQNSPNCNCMPACTSISYNTETSQADFNWPKVFEAFQADTNEFPGIHMARLTIFFKDMSFTTSERNEFYSHTDFLAKCGGLFALLTGFSFLTIAEIFYYLSLRLICNIKKYGRRFWSGSIHLMSDNDRID